MYCNGMVDEFNVMHNIIIEDDVLKFAMDLSANSFVCHHRSIYGATQFC
jgi:hypothetical protein